jgi:hypothetical protein
MGLKPWNSEINRKLSMDEIFHDRCWHYWIIFLPKWCFQTPRSLFSAWDQSIPWERTWKFSDISYFTYLRHIRGVRKILKTDLKTRLKIKETLYTFFSRNTQLSLLIVSQLRHFQCFWKIHWGLSHKPDVLGKICKQIRTQIKQES